VSSLICRIDMDKQGGITVEVVNGARTQRMTMDGTRIQLEVEGPAGKSQIIQDDASVTVKCNRFVVDAGTIECKAKTTSSYESGASLMAKAPQVSLKADAALQMNAATATLAASGSCSVTSGMSLALSAGGAANLQAGSAVNVEAGAAANVIAGGSLTVLGASAKMVGADVKVLGITSIPGLIPPF
jgi:phage baseplate assembly protein gpV